MSNDLIETLLPVVDSQCRVLASVHCRNDKDYIALAIIYALQAEDIWKRLGGPKNAAAQFYALADRCATEVKP